VLSFRLGGAFRLRPRFASYSITQQGEVDKIGQTEGRNVAYENADVSSAAKPGS